MTPLTNFLIEAKQGDYVSVDATIPDVIKEAVKKANFSSGVIPDDELHATLIYSIGTMVDHDMITKKLQKFTLPIEGKVAHLTKFDALPKDGQRAKDECTIVMEVDAQELNKIHSYLKKLGLKHSYDEYRPHVSLVYDVPIKEAEEKMQSLEKVVVGKPITFHKITVDKLK